MRRGDHLVLVCNLPGGESVEVREVDAQDHIVSDLTVDVGGLASEAVLATNGDVLFFTSLQDASSSLVTILANGVSVGGPSLPLHAAPFDELMAPLAVARDGTLVVVTSSSVVAIASSVVRWSQPITTQVPVTNLMLDDATVVAAGSAYDLASGAVLWSLPGDAIAIASAGPGKMYTLSDSTLALIASP